MKIGLISFHNAANHGASLQAYALEKFLELNGFNCEYIDYQNEMRRRSYDMGYMIKSSLIERRYKDMLKYILGAPLLSLRNKSFSIFYKKFLKYSEKTYYTPEQLQETNEVYDVFISGSDQIWNPHHNGNDVSYLLSFVKDNKPTISYSSSLSVISIPNDLKADYIRCLNKICHLSTREMSGVKLINELTGRDAKLVLDPVFLLGKEDWLDILKKNVYNYRFVFSDTNRADQISQFVKYTGYPLAQIKHHKLSRYTTLSDFLNPKVKVEYTLSPLEYVQNILESELVLSASFHCTAFAIIMNTPFVCFLTNDEGKDERLKSLLSHFGLEDRIFTDKMTTDDVMKPIDWQNVNSLLNNKRKDSMEFLLNSLK